jgi:hypothetical protein
MKRTSFAVRDTYAAKPRPRFSTAMAVVLALNVLPLVALACAVAYTALR